MLARGGDSLLWQCHKCIADGAAGNNTRTEAKIDVLTKLLQDMVERLERIERANGEKSIDDKIEAVVERKMKYMIEETNEKEKRKRNIIVVNLPESNERTVEERKRDDIERVRQLVDKIADVPGDEIGEPTRLGQMQIGQNSRPRIIRVVIKTVDGKEKIMRNVYALNEGVALMAQRTENGERDLVIRNMKIIKRQRYGQEADNTH